MVKYYELKEIKLEKRENYLRKIFSEISMNNISLGLLRIVIPKGIAARKHYHRKHLEVLIFLKGVGEVIVEGDGIVKRIIAGRGSIIVIYPREKHTIRAVGGDLEILVIKAPNLLEDKVLL